MCESTPGNTATRAPFIPVGASAGPRRLLKNCARVQIQPDSGARGVGFSMRGAVFGAGCGLDLQANS